MNVIAGARRVVFLLPVAAIAAFACSHPAAEDSTRTKSQTQADGIPPRCSLNPWDTGATRCGTLTVLPAHTTCLENGFLGPNVTLTMPAPDENGFRSATVSGDLGVTTHAYSCCGTAPTEWDVASTVNADGTTMTFDAIITAGGALDASEILRFDVPEFFVQNIPMLEPTTTIELCNYRQGHSLGVPPPTEAGATKVTCGFLPGDPGVAGSSTPPGPTVTSMSDIRWYVSVDPAPPDPARLQYRITANGQDLGSTNTALMDGHADQGFFDPRLTGQSFDLALTFSYGADSCVLYWHVDESSESEPDAGSGGHTW